MSTLSASSPLVLNVPLTLGSAPTDGVDEVVTLAVTGTPTGGSLTVTYGGQTTSAIAYNATSTTVQTALVALSTIGSGNVTCTGGPLPGTAVVLTFGGILSGTNIGSITTTDSLTGGSSPESSITVNTGGVVGSFRGAPANAVLMSTTGVGFLYYNSGTSQRPVWTLCL